MATPAAILSILVKTQGAAAAAAELRGMDSAARKANSALTNVENTSRRAGASVNALGRESHKSGKAMRSIGHGAAYALGAGGFGGGMYALFDITRKSIKEFRESQTVSRQTGAVLKSTGGAANVTAKQVDALANSIKRKSAIDDETIASGENMLLTFTKIRNEAGKGNNIFDQATQSITDMSVAMNRGATPSAEQLSKTAILVGKALNDPIKGATALRRVGVDLDAQQQQNIKTLESHGQHLQAQKIILRELTHEFGGSAAAQATSAKRMQVALGDLAEKIGGALAPVIERVTKKGSVFIDQMLKGTGAGGRFAQTMKNIWSALQPLVGALKLIVSFLARHPALLAAAAGAWAAYKVAALIAIGASKAGLLGLFGQSTMGKLKGRATAAGTTVGTTFAQKAGLAAAAGVAGWEIGRALRKHVPLARKIGDQIGHAFGKFFVNSGDDALQKFADKLLDWANGLKSTINTVVGDVNKSLISVLPKTGRGQGGPQGTGHTNFTGGSLKSGDRAMVAAAAARYGISPNLLWGVYGKETAFGANVKTSSAGAKGAFQFMPGTAKSYDYPFTNRETTGVFKQQAAAAAHYLSDLLKRFHGNVASALMSYSGGGYYSVPGAGPGKTVSSPPGGGKKKGAGAGADMPADLAWAQRMVGHFKESTGSNTGPELNRLQKTFGTYAAAWCAEFATTALVNAGFPKSILTARVSDLNKWAKAGAKGLSFTTSPSPGDLMTFGNRHVGIVEKVNTSKGTVTTIAGNTGKGQVSRSTYALSAGKYISTNAAGYTPFKPGKPDNRAVIKGINDTDALAYMQSRLDHFDLMVQAGLLSAAKGLLRKRKVLENTIPTLSGDAQLQAMIALRALPKPKMLTPAQKTWGKRGSGGGMDQLLWAMGISQPGLPRDTTINNPWLQAMLDHISNLVAAGLMTEAQGNATKVGYLQKALPSLTGENGLIAQGMIKSLSEGPSGGGFFSVLEDRLSEIDAQVRAGDLTAEQGRALKIQTIQDNLGNPDLTDRERLDLRGDLKDLGTALEENASAVTAAMDALKEEIKKNNDFAQSVTATQLGTTMRALADFINGQIYGNYNNRSSSASSGSVARY